MFDPEEERSIRFSEAKRSVLWSGPGTYDFNDGHGLKARSSVTILPLDIRDGVTVGWFYNPERGLFSKRVGVQQLTERLQPNFYEFNGHLLKDADRPNPNTVYLPLQLTDVGLQLGKESHLLYGIKSNSPLKKLPLLTCFYDGGELKIGGLYHEDGKVCRWINAKDTFGLEGVLYDLQRGAYRAPDVDSLVHQYERVSPTIIQKSLTDGMDWSDPVAIKKKLDSYVIGQEEAKLILSDVFSEYILRRRNNLPARVKENILLLGPTGTGKTYMLKRLAEFAGIRFKKTAASGKSTAGYVGEPLLDAIEDLEDGGVLFIDEIDKIAKGGNAGFFHSGLQDELIGILEDGEVKGGGSKKVDTSRILFVGAGAFVGIEDHIRSRIGLRQKGEIGYGAERPAEEDVFGHVSDSDVIKYGMKPELVARFRVLGPVHPLKPHEKIAALKEAKGTVMDQCRESLELRGYSLDVTDDAYQEIVARADPATNMRGVEGKCITLFRKLRRSPSLYADGEKIVLTGSLVKAIMDDRQLNPGIVTQGNETSSVPEALEQGSALAYGGSD